MREGGARRQLYDEPDEHGKKKKKNNFTTTNNVYRAKAYAHEMTDQWRLVYCALAVTCTDGWTFGVMGSITVWPGTRTWRTRVCVPRPSMVRLSRCAAGGCSRCRDGCGAGSGTRGRACTDGWCARRGFAARVRGAGSRCGGFVTI